MGAFLNPTDYSDLKGISEEAMTMTATVTRKGAFVDEGGGAGYHEPGEVVTIPCRLSPLGRSQGERLIADQLQEVGLELLVVPVGADLRLDDNGIVVSNGKTYDVRGRVPRATNSVHDRYLVKEDSSGA